jgi:hemerythrin
MSIATSVPVVLRWNAEFETNVKIIDDQHKRLIDLINALHQAMMEGKAKPLVGGVLNELISYAKTHFATEERLMRNYAYPSSHEHRSLHADFTRQVLDFCREYNVGRATLSIPLMNMLKTWLNDHILGTDKAFGAFLNSKGVR